MKRRTRRQFLIEAGKVSVAASVLTGCGETDEHDVFVGDAVVITPPEPVIEYEYDGPLGPENMFVHGVASGDPLSTAVILWTHLSDDQADSPLDVFWEMAEDSAFVDRVAAGTTTTSVERGYTVKVDAMGLKPGRTYYYRFWQRGQSSPIGRTRTAPEGAVKRLRFGVASCSNLSKGYFKPYGHLAAQKDLDAVIHLGDYLYEYGSSGFIPERGHQPPKEMVALEDYRTRFAQYRRDPDLQETHRQHPFIVVWDDHEFANNAWKDGAVNHQPDQEGEWSERKAVAMQAYYEWMPIREAEPGVIFRTLRYGDLVDLIMLDTRIYGRDETVDTDDTEGLANEERRMLGEEQEKWLREQLAASKAQWRLIGQQVVFSPVAVAGKIINADQWDGYPHERKRVLKMLEELSVENLVILTGDIHSSWAGDITIDPENYDPETGEGAIGVEFVTPGITSGFPLEPDLVVLAEALLPYVKYGEVSSRGCMILDVDEERVEAHWRHYKDVTDPTDTGQPAATYYSMSGTPNLQPADKPSPPREDAPEMAP